MRSHEQTRNALTRGGTRKALSGLALAVLALGAVLAAACGSDEPAEVSAPPAADPAPAPAPAAAPANDLPEVTVVNVVSGESLVLSSLAPADRPILAWFWAPH